MNREMSREAMQTKTERAMSILLSSIDEASLKEFFLPNIKPALEELTDAWLQSNTTLKMYDGETSWKEGTINEDDGWVKTSTNCNGVNQFLHAATLLAARKVKAEHLTVRLVTYRRPEGIGYDDSLIAVFTVLNTDSAAQRHVVIQTNLFSRHLHQAVAHHIPDADSRSINEPCYLMSAVATRNMFGGHYPHYWEFEKLVKLAKDQGWYSVTQYGNQILFVAKLSIRQEGV